MRSGGKSFLHLGLLLAGSGVRELEIYQNKLLLPPLGERTQTRRREFRYLTKDERKQSKEKRIFWC